MHTRIESLVHTYFNINRIDKSKFINKLQLLASSNYDEFSSTECYLILFFDDYDNSYSWHVKHCNGMYPLGVVIFTSKEFISMIMYKLNTLDAEFLKDILL